MYLSFCLVICICYFECFILIIIMFNCNWLYKPWYNYWLKKVVVVILRSRMYMFHHSSSPSFFIFLFSVYFRMLLLLCPEVIVSEYRDLKTIAFGYLKQSVYCDTRSTQKTFKCSNIFMNVTSVKIKVLKSGNFNYTLVQD